jgi:hypothetical protein
MSALTRFVTRLLNFTTRRRGDARLREEMESHLAIQTEENIRAGMAPAEARRHARLKFGAMEAVREDYHAEERHGRDLRVLARRHELAERGHGGQRR